MTIATNMAGRGTDIVLGGNLESELEAAAAAVGEGGLPEAERASIRAAWQTRHDQVLAAGGLHIIGTERHESRRIDNQLRGRSGRQGDPGSSRFYLSMEDNLMRIFGDPGRTKKLLQFAGMKPGEVIESNMLSRQIEKAQRKVEAHNFDIRKQLLMFDDVANDQRKVIYQQRTEILAAEDLSDSIGGIRAEAVGTVLDQYLPKNADPQSWDLDGLATQIRKDFGATIEPKGWMSADAELVEHNLRERVVEAVDAHYADKTQRVGVEIMRQVEKDVMLRTLDQQWREHLAAMDYLRQGIHLRGYAQKDYRFEYKREAFELFSAMLDRVKFETASTLATAEIRTEQEIEREEAQRRERLARALQAQHAEAASALSAGGDVAEAPTPAPRSAAAGVLPGAAASSGAARPTAPVVEAGTFVRGERKVGRNEPCPCGSGKKFKHCHGALADAG